MLSLLKTLIKLAALSVIILLLGNWVEVGGKTISDQIKVQLSHAEKTGAVSSVRNWANRVTEDAREGIQRKMTKAPPEKIHPTERQKLRELIHELNSAN